jgi:hypothetical protein
LPASVQGRHGNERIARQVHGLRDEIRRLRQWPEPDPQVMGQRLVIIAQQLAGVAAAGAEWRERQARAMGEARPSGPEAEAASAQALRDLVAAPACLPAVRGWLRPGHFARPEQGELYAVMRDMDAAGLPVDPVTVSWEAARRGVPADAAELAEGMGPFAVASAREVHRRGLLAQAERAGRDIQAAAAEPAAGTTRFLRTAQAHIAPLGTGPARHASREADSTRADPVRQQGTRAMTRQPPVAREPIPEAVP